ncbi:MAG: hypothetical protein H7Z12_19955 [Rhodospirillaceae bacterium]|nr:hypothetical protein [Rhodospirillales bacterium]
MAKVTAAPTNAELDAAFKLARNGRSRKLVEIIRSFSRDDLVAGLSATNGDLNRGLAYAAGRKEFRQKYLGKRHGQ